MKDKLKGIYEILKKDTRLVNEDGELLKNKIQELTLKTDGGLLKTLLDDELTKNMFFTNIDGIFIFDKTKFMWMIDSKDFLPDSYTAFLNKIMLIDNNGNSIKKSDNVVLSFPCKDCVVEMDSTDEKEERNEMFFNEVLMKSELDTLLAPKILDNVKKYSKGKYEEVVEIKDNDNLIINGNNLLALHSLLPRYRGKIKLMYWDILYNTESDKVPYNDSFKHSSWLTMMKNRLEIAKLLLSNDGSICIQCDDNEMAYLKVLCDEIFGRNNFVNSVAIKMSEVSGTKMAHIDKKLVKLKEYILIYKIKDLIINPVKIQKDGWDSEYNKVMLNFSKDDKRKIDKIASKDNIVETDIELIDNILSRVKISSISIEMKKENIDTNDKENVHKWLKDNSFRIFRTAASKSVLQLARDKKEYCNNILFSVISKRDKKLYIVKSDFSVKSNSPRVQVLFAEDYLNVYLGDIWYDISTTGLESEGGVNLKNGKKPEQLIKRLIEMLSNEEDIVLDAFLGSGTTAAVAHKMNRKYIGIEQLNSHVEKSLKRLVNVINGEKNGISPDVNWNGGGSFIYSELGKNSQKYIDAINKAITVDELNVLYNKLKDSDFISYRVDINNMKKENNAFLALSEEEKRKLLINIVDKNTLYINYCDINDESYDISDNIKQFNNSFYGKEV